MINRILIRMKVVQLLYSYLLTRSDFKIQPSPERPTRDSRFAYETYINLTLLLLELAGYKVGSTTALTGIKNNKLALKMVKALAADEGIREITAAGSATIGDYDDTVDTLYRVITASAVFTDFEKKRSKDVADEVGMWTVVLDTIIAKSREVEAAARRNPAYTKAGFDAGVRMLRETLAAYSDNSSWLTQARQSLENSLDKAYDLYHLLLMLPVELTRIQRDRLEQAKEKYIPTSEDLNPDTRFIDNSFVADMAASTDMEEYLKARPMSLEPHFLIMKRLLEDVLQSKYYADYMAESTTDHVRDCDFWRAVMKNVILPSDALAELLESTSIYWNDDLEIMGTFALKTIKQAASNDGPVVLLPKYKDDDDARFGAQLFTDTVNNREVYRSYIDKFIDPAQWDADRLAFMDIVIMMVAISELLNFPSIPIPVTLNEYIEIANSYSTPRSGQFVNGMLFSIINYLRDEGKLNKN